MYVCVYMYVIFRTYVQAQALPQYIQFQCSKCCDQQWTQWMWMERNCRADMKRYLLGATEEVLYQTGVSAGGSRLLIAAAAAKYCLWETCPGVVTLWQRVVGARLWWGQGLHCETEQQNMQKIEIQSEDECYGSVGR